MPPRRRSTDTQRDRDRDEAKSGAKVSPFIRPRPLSITPYFYRVKSMPRDKGPCPRKETKLFSLVGRL